MFEFNKLVKDAQLFSYPLSSGDMRFIQVNERIIFLRNELELGPVLRGEISGCGTSCFADLSQIFLEFGMNCEGCRDEKSAEAEIVAFGEHLGVALANALRQYIADQSTVEQLTRVFVIVFNSMDVPFSDQRSAEGLHFTLAHCPLCAAGDRSGLNREMALARFGFAAFCLALVRSISLDWQVIKPSLRESDEDLYEVIIARA
jgi:hypothetical protein